MNEIENDDDRMIEVSNKVADEVVVALYEKEGKPKDFDFATAMFSIFIDAIRVLTNVGWTTENLIEEVRTHSEADDHAETCTNCSDRTTH